jgi:Flp pilus assembly protein TadG
VRINGEKGVALPMVMIAVMIGALVIPPFLANVGTSLVGSRYYMQAIDAEYAADAGAEHAVWNLTDGDVTASIPNAGDSASYSLAENVNGLTTSVKISNCWEVLAWDNFNSGTWTGGGGWSGNWTHSGAASITTSGTPYEGSYHLVLNNSTGYVARSVDLSKEVNAHLRFRAKVDSFEPGDNAVCMVSNNGVDWNTAHTWQDVDDDSTYHYYDINLTDYGLTGTFWIAFQANMNASGDNFYVDKLEIDWVVGASETIATENYESGNSGGGVGWSGNWTLTGESLITPLGVPHGGSNHLRLRNSTGRAARSVDLSDRGVVHIKLWVKVDGFEPNDAATLLVSSNGYSWQTAYTWSDSVDDNTYHYYDIDLSPYTLSDTFWIAFQAGMNNNNDTIYFDDILVDDMHGYAITTAAGDRVIKASVDMYYGPVDVNYWYIK